MSFCIKRTYNRHGDCDYLTDFDPQWVTVCAGFRSPDIIKYPTKAAAEKVVAGFASRYAEKFPDCEHKFEAVAFPPAAALPQDAVPVIQAYAAKHGKKWKSQLAEDWATGKDTHFRTDPTDYSSCPMAGSVLRSIRNSYGPSWLANYELPTETN